MYTTTTDEAAVFNFVDSVATDADVRAFIAAGGADSATIVEIEKLYPNRKRNRSSRHAMETVYCFPH
jgi:hypothetical protein